ncbi:tetratricopeptide repeat protein [Rugamonas sp.]|uniref:tetratricopeptide repeat protein n=1 Tax=Rugamonas sp. TaxID=1926287 RepID=UPI0025E159E5|nr:tetratricopeptide repeat protein [Rugamonas sp.]
MKNAFAIVTLSALLSACAVAPQKQDESAPAPAAEPVAVADAAAAPVDEVLPNVELTSDLMYKLTKAELEFKAGQWQSAYITMLALAQQTRDPRLAKRATDIALAAKQAPEALVAIRLWRDLAPASEEATQYFLGFAVLNPDLSEAERIFAERLKTVPAAGRGLAMFQMQQFLLRAKDKAAAFGLLDRVLASYGDLLETHLVLAQSAFAAGDTERARTEALRALAIKPDSELAALTQAQVAPDLDTATAGLVAFLASNPNAREVRGAYARILVDAKQYEPARAQFLVLLKQQPDNVATLYALGVMAMETADAAGAETYFKRFLAVVAEHPGEDRDPSKVLLILADLAEERGDFDGARQWLAKIDAADPRLALTARLKSAQLTARKGDIDGARQELAALKSSDAGEAAQIIQTDAQILRDAGDNRAAYTVLENAIKRFPDNPDVLYDYALAAEKLDRLDVMEASLRQVMAAAPDNQHAYNALGYSLAERNVRLTEAYALIDKALKMAPDDPFIMDSMGWVQYRLGHLSEAEALLRRAYKLRNDPEIAVHLGEVLWVEGDKSGAEKVWLEARAKDPKNDALKSTLARLNLNL